MNAVDIKRDWEELSNSLYFATKNIREGNLKIFDDQTGELLPEPDAIVLFDFQVCPIWKTITPRVMWSGKTIDGSILTEPNVHTLLSIHFAEDGKMSVGDFTIAGIGLQKDKTLYESIQDFNEAEEAVDNGEMIILYIIEE